MNVGAGRDRLVVVLAPPGAGRDAAAALWAEAGITDPAEEIDAAEIYVPFSWFEPMWLESLGFAPEGAFNFLEATWEDVSTAVHVSSYSLKSLALAAKPLMVEGSAVVGLTFDQISYVDGLPSSIRVIGKGDKERTVPLSPTAQRALVQWLKVRRTEGHPTSRYVWSYLTGKHRGEPLAVRTVQAMTTATAKKAGLDPAKVSPHKMRHSYATALVEQGRSLHEIGTILGHENPATTAIYGRVKARQLEQAASALPDVL